MAFMAIVVPILISTGIELSFALLSKAISPTPQSGRLGQDDFHTLESSYALPLPKCWGVERVPGNITWAGPVVEHKYNVGGGLFSDGVDVFYYTQDVEYSFTLGPAKGFVKIWLGDKVIYDASSAPGDAQSNTFGNSLHQYIGHLLSGPAKDRLIESYELFLGTEVQQPSAIISSVEGYGAVPADRGVVKVVIKTLNLTKLGGNALPAASAIIQFADFIGVPVAGTPVDAIASSVVTGGDIPPNTVFSNVTNTTATITRLASSPLGADPNPTATWSSFAAPTVPAGATITGIYPKATISRAPHALGVVTVTVAGQNLYSAGGTTGDPDLPSTTYYGASIGTSLIDLSGKTATFKNDSTLNIAATDVSNVEFVGFEVRYTTNNIPPTGTTLGAILGSLFQSCGFNTDQYEIATDVASIPVKGFKTEQKAIRDVVRELMDIYPFDGYESDGKLKIVHRAGVTEATIEEADFVMSGDAESGFRLSEPITQEDEIPMKVDVHYADIDRDFQDNIQHSKRIIEPSATMESLTVKSISTNVVMNANEAAQAAERNLWEPWATKRGGNCQLMPKHLLLDAAGKVQFNYKNQSLIQRIKTASLGAGLGIQLSTVSHDSDIYTSAAAGSSSSGFPVPLPSSADPGLVNEPVMFEPPFELVPPGAAGSLWIQVSGADPDYGGCEVFLSLDGTIYQSLGDMAQGITGFLIADYPAGDDPDTADTLSIDLTECAGQLPTRTQSTADGFFDMAYLGVNSSPVVRDFELACPTVSTERATASIFDLDTYIRRGVQGSTSIDHPTGSRFADLTGALRINLSEAWVGVTLYFKFAAYNLDHQHPEHQQADDLSDCVVYTYSPLGVTGEQLWYINGSGSTPTTTTLAQETGHNTSAYSKYNAANFAANFTGTTWVNNTGTTASVDSAKSDDSINPVTPAHVSRTDVHAYFPANSSIPVYAHITPWFGHAGHVQIGVNCNTTTWVQAAIEDAAARGINGFIIDWYGEGSFEDQVTLKIQSYLASRPANTFKFAICFDKGLKSSTGVTLSESVLQSAITHCQSQYFSDSNYIKISSKPVLHFFGVASVLGDTAMAAVKAATTGSSGYWMSQGSSLISKSYIDGCYDWAHPYASGVSGPDPYNLAAMDSFASDITAASSKKCFLSAYPGFNGYLTKSVSWSKGKDNPRNNGACMVTTAGHANGNITSQIAAIMLVTWNDWEEGSQIETGVDNDLTVSASISTTNVNFSVSGGTGDESTIDHYEIWATTDVTQTNPSFISIDPLASVATGVGTYDLSTAGLVAGTQYKIYVEAVGKPCIHNKMSAGASYTA
jgi:hypothetical protein